MYANSPPRRSSPALAALVAAGALSGCGHAIPVYLTEGSMDRPLEAQMLVTQAGELLGYPIEFREDVWGSITVHITWGQRCDWNELRERGYDRCVSGHSLIEKGCRRAVVAAPHRTVIGHELGHALGLEHIDDDTTNVMSARGSSTEIYDWQIDAMADELVELEFCGGK